MITSLHTFALMLLGKSFGFCQGLAIKIPRYNGFWGERFDNG
jgi:hypothetical protein